MKQKRTSFTRIAAAVVAAVIVLLALWTLWENVTVGVTRYTVSGSRLPASFDHYRIVVVSDLHNAEFGTDNETLLSLIEAEAPDLIAVTGDLVDSNHTELGIAEELIHQLVQIAPCYYVTGNHEALLGEQYRELETFLSEEGVVVLCDAVITLTEGTDRIQLAGLNDPSFSSGSGLSARELLDAQLKGLPLTDDYTLLLSHRPEAFDTYVENGVDLVLCGHAHGGQFRLPFIGGLFAPGQGFLPKYDAGVYSEHQTTMVVSRGIGNSKIPVRFFNQPEIVSIELVCAD